MASLDTAGAIETPKTKTSKMWFWTSPGKMFLAMALITAGWLSQRWYQQWAGWEFGMDSTHPNFDFYWMNLFYFNLAFTAALGIGMWTYLWLTRDRDMVNLAPREEVKRIFNFVTILTCYVFAVYWAGSFFAEQDAAWHQVAIRDTSFTPSHIVLFYGAFPFYIVLGITSYIYAMTRLPIYSRRISIPLTMAVAGPFMLMPNLGFNEWGHAFWVFEEIFTAPIHYGFVIFGWTALALGGVLMEVVNRFVNYLFPAIYGKDFAKELTDKKSPMSL
jgi:methane/ammonia monooxygenase subunit C